MKIVLGSTSPHKLEALSRAIRILNLKSEITELSVKSEVSLVPQNFDETFRGAYNRAKNASIVYPDANYYLGIESGLITLSENIPPIDLAVCVFRNKDTIVSIGTSPGLMYPYSDFSEAKKTNSDCLANKGSIIKTGDPSDPHFEITHGRISRAELLTIGICSCLVHITPRKDSSILDVIK
jgi:non-canonical (house-cleaning) NTP pyrophosphatase